MAFVLAIEDFDAPIEIALLQNEDELLGRVCIGFDDETGSIYSIWAAVRKAVTNPFAHEIHFNVVEATTEDGNEDEIFHNDGMQTHRFLSKEHRKVVLSCLCTVLQVLVQKAEPEVVFMMTVTPHLPGKALRKYEAICNAMREIGYDARKDSPFHGTQTWIMERSGQSLTVS